MTLQRGAEIRCPHCRAWHGLDVGRTDGTPYTREMLYFWCSQPSTKGLYFAGTIGTTSQFETRLLAEGS